MVRPDSVVLRRKAECKGHVKILQLPHLAIEPVRGIGPEIICRLRPRAQVLDSEFFEPPDGIIQPMIFKVEPLADAEFRRAAGKKFQRLFRRAILPQEPHIEVPVI